MLNFDDFYVKQILRFETSFNPQVIKTISTTEPSSLGCFIAIRLSFHFPLMCDDFLKERLRQHEKLPSLCGNLHETSADKKTSINSY